MLPQKTSYTKKNNGQEIATIKMIEIIDSRSELKVINSLIPNFSHTIHICCYFNILPATL